MTHDPEISDVLRRLVADARRAAAAVTLDALLYGEVYFDADGNHVPHDQVDPTTLGPPWVLHPRTGRLLPPPPATTTGQ